MSQKKRAQTASIRCFLIVVSFLALSACGGGGGAPSTGTPTGTGGSPPPGNLSNPSTEPPIPQAAYSGPQTQSTINSSNASIIVQNVFPAMVFVSGNAKDVANPLTPYNYTTTIKGSAGGQDVVTGTIAADGSGWVEQQYEQYADGGGTVQNGVFIIFQQSVTGSVTSAGTLGFSDYQVAYQGQTFVYNGNITYTFAGSAYTLVGNISVSDGSYQSYMSGLTISEASDGDATYSGRVYDSVDGYVTVSSPTPVSLGNNDIGFPQIYQPNATGEILLTGSASALHVQPLNVYFAFLGLDTTGSGTIDSGTRLDYSTGDLDATQPTHSSVQALAEVPSAATSGAAITVDGRYSFTPNGFVSYAWKLLSVPSGSAVRTTGDGATQSFTPDLSGTYLWQLTASAGGKSTFDLLPVDVTVASGSAALASNPTLYKAQGYIYAHAGDTVTLDARASPAVLSTQADAYGSIWSLNTPAGSIAALADPTSTVTTFTADKPGFYTAVLAEHGGSSGLPYEFATVIAVDEPYRFAPPVPIFTGTGVNTLGDLALGSFGSASTAGSTIVFDNSSVGVDWVTTGSDGLFKTPNALSLMSGSVPLLGTDLNGDGVTDFVSDHSAAGFCSMDFSESSLSAGSLLGGYGLQTVSLPYPPMCQGWFMGQYTGGTVGGKAAVIAIYQPNVPPDYFPVFQTFRSNGSGTMQQPVLTAIEDMNSAVFEQVFDFQLKDVDGDGEPDLVATVGFGPGGYNNTTSVYLQIYHGNGDGTFTYTASYALTGSTNTLISSAPMLIGDFNGDGKLDIAVAYNDTLDLFYGDGTGNFSNRDTRIIDANAITQSSSTEYLAEADINGDGHPDLMVTGVPADAPNGPPVVKMFLSGSSGTLGSVLEYPITDLNYRTPSGIVSGDFNQDGLQDLVLSNNDLGTNSAAIFFMPQVQALASGIITAYHPQSAPAPAAQEEETGQRATATAAVPRGVAVHPWSAPVVPSRVLYPQS